MIIFSSFEIEGNTEEEIEEYSEIIEHAADYRVYIFCHVNVP